MPDEDVQRVSYPTAPTKGGGHNVPIPEDAPVESSPTDAEAAPSAEEQVSEQGTPPTTPPEKMFNMPPPERWEELRTQREAAERRAQQAEQLAQMALQKLQTPSAPAAPMQDPWDGKVNHPDPATAQFYQEQKRLFEYEARKVAEQQGQSVLQAVDAGRRELAAIKIAQFRNANPDIKPGSQEETAMAALVQQGYDLETAKKLTLFDKLEAENRALKSKQSAIPRKAAANVESSSGIPESAGLPGRPSNWQQRASEIIDKGGEMTDVANAIFGRKRTV